MIKRYPNAQDGAENVNFVLGRKTTFREAFPEVTSLELEIKATPLGFGHIEIYTYSLETAPGQFTPCPNPNCRGGGFDIGTFLYQLILSGKTSGETGGACVGDEKLGRDGRRSCIYSFSGKVSIGYGGQAATAV